MNERFHFYHNFINKREFQMDLISSLNLTWWIWVSVTKNKLSTLKSVNSNQKNRFLNLNGLISFLTCFTVYTFSDKSTKYSKLVFKTTLNTFAVFSDWCTSNTGTEHFLKRIWTRPVALKWWSKTFYLT